MSLTDKLAILADAAKYDISCASSGSDRTARKGSLGSADRAGICHSFTPDGRCISLLKILMNNYCIYDCAYCVNRSSNDVPRASFSVDEVVSLTMNFYRRNYIEGLFLSSAIVQSPNYTMEMLMQVVERLRLKEHFGGYIHLKAIPGADQALIDRAGVQVDRMSVNIELPSAQSLKLLAPDKSKTDILRPMQSIHSHIVQNRQERQKFRQAPSYVPAGQSTQMIVGASAESDLDILRLSASLYEHYALKRVYYSAYVPVNRDKKLPALTKPPTVRENRLYQSDWLLRKYGFRAEEILDESRPNLEMDYDPKTVWALNHPENFPIELNKAPFEQLIRIPGIGIRGAQKIVSARKVHALDFADLRKMGLSVKRAQYFITCRGRYYGAVPYDNTVAIRRALRPRKTASPHTGYEQLTLFDNHLLPLGGE